MPDATMKAKVARVLTALDTVLATPEIEVSDDPLGELVATILSQNTTDTNSGRAFDRLCARFPTWREVLDASRDELIAAIRVAGLAETKAETIQSALTALDADGGEPSLDCIRLMSDDEAIRFLSAFKGVGVKTAACVLLFGLGRDVCPVDTHVHRVLNRLGVVVTKSPDATFAALQPLAPEGCAYTLHVLLVRFGRRVCHARNPLCSECVLFDECVFDAKHGHAERQTAASVRGKRQGG
jgi:endonuclease-3